MKLFYYSFVYTFLIFSEFFYKKLIYYFLENRKYLHKIEVFIMKDDDERSPDEIANESDDMEEDLYDEDEEDEVK